MTKAKWIAIPMLAAAFALGGAAQASLIKAADNTAATDFSAKKGGGKGHAKGHTKGHTKGHFKVKHATKHHWRGDYAYRYRGANYPYFCPPGQAKKPGLGSAHMC